MCVSVTHGVAHVEVPMKWPISKILSVILMFFGWEVACLTCFSSSSLCAEVSRVPGRKETLRVPPSETVAYQRPDHRLWPSTRTLIVPGPWKWPGEIWLDQKTPKGPVDCPAGSWSCWDTFHFNSSECQWNQGAVFQKEKRKTGWDHRLVIKCCPLTLSSDKFSLWWLDYVLL